jgi:hypothetical protein
VQTLYVVGGDAAHGADGGREEHAGGKLEAVARDHGAPAAISR